MKKKRKPDMTISQKVVAIAAAKKKRKKGRFFQEMGEELKRVSWTTREELYRCTRIVVAAIFLFGLGIYIIDVLIRSVLDGVRKLAWLIGG